MLHSLKIFPTKRLYYSYGSFNNGAVNLKLSLLKRTQYNVIKVHHVEFLNCYHTAVLTAKGLSRLSYTVNNKECIPRLTVYYMTK